MSRLQRFNSYLNVGKGNIYLNTGNEDGYVESPLGQGRGTRLSNHTTDKLKEEKTKKGCIVSQGRPGMGGQEQVVCREGARYRPNH